MTLRLTMRQDWDGLDNARATTTMGRRYVGESIRRIEDPPLLRGRATFVGDVDLGDALHAAIFRSDVAHAAVRRIDTARARALPGVVAVFTAADTGPVGRIPTTIVPRPALHECFQPPIAAETVRYVGEPLAVVVARDRYVAEDALEVIRADLEPLPVIADAPRGLAPGARLVHEALGTNLADRIEVRRGDAERALRGAPHRLRASFTIQRHTGVPMEPRGLAAALDRRTRVLTVWGPTKMVHRNRSILAGLLAYPEQSIRFIEPRVGGGFGLRGEFYPEDFLIPWAAMRLDAPLRWIEDRHEHFLAVNQCRQQWHEVEIGLSEDGAILALVDRIMIDLGAYVRPNAFVAPELTPASLPGPYRIADFSFEVSCGFSNKTPAGSYRGPGQVEATFVRERLLDLAARELTLDPAEIRRRNLIEIDAMPYRVGTTIHGRPVVYDTGDYARAFGSVQAALDYPAVRARQAAERRNGRRLGIGFACAVDASGIPPWESARVSVEASGRVAVYSGTADLGQGIETALAQICAEELGVRLEDVTVIHGDTALVPAGVGAYASRSVAVGGSAVLEAAREVRTKALRLAAHLLEASPDDLVIDAGTVSVRGAPDHALTMRELARAARAEATRPPGLEPELEASHRFTPPDLTYPYAMHAALVEVDADTGTVRVLRYVIVADVGRAINPMLVEGQVLGCLAQGIGGALLEEIVHDDQGQPITTTLMDYLLPTALEMPDETIIRLQQDALSPHNPLGAKGAGEVGILGVPAAIANAVEDALASEGVRIHALPLSHDRVAGLIRAARAGAPA